MPSRAGSFRTSSRRSRGRSGERMSQERSDADVLVERVVARERLQTRIVVGLTALSVFSAGVAVIALLTLQDANVTLAHRSQVTDTINCYVLAQAKFDLAVSHLITLSIRGQTTGARATPEELQNLAKEFDA